MKFSPQPKVFPDQQSSSGWLHVSTSLRATSACFYSFAVKTSLCLTHFKAKIMNLRAVIIKRSSCIEAREYMIIVTLVH